MMLFYFHPGGGLSQSVVDGNQQQQEVGTSEVFHLENHPRILSVNAAKLL